MGCAKRARRSPPATAGLTKFSEEYVNRRMSGVLGVAAALGLAATAVPAGTATAVPVPDGADPSAHARKSDDRTDPLDTKRRALKAKAAELVATGQKKVQAKGGGKVVKVGDGQWVEYGTQTTAQLLTFLVDFGDQADPRFPEAPTGPVHNQIPEPAADDNSTYWQPDFSEQHFEDMFFNGMPEQGGESFKQLYTEMSSGRFDLQGDVADWVQVPFNEASYGQTESNADMTRFVQDSANAWYADQLASGKTKAEIVDYLKSFDIWDRYDIDGDGNYNEADGYIDHFQAVHAGEGEEAGAPEWAIWSHRWAVNPSGRVGPSGFPKVGGIQIGDTDLWIRDYTTEPENGGLGVFAHEFAHDLGLPDYYDTAGGENSTAFWTLMSSGSWLSHGDGAIGTTPNHMGAHEKAFLGWLDFTTVAPGATQAVDLGPSYHATKKPQAAIVQLPDGQEFIDVFEPQAGKYLYSGTGDDYEGTATSPAFTVPAGGTLTAKVNYQIETDWDYAYVEVSDDGGATFEPVDTNLSTDTSPYGQNEGHGITGSTEGEWVALTADLSAYAGSSVQLRFRQWTDGAAHELGFAVDDIAVGSALTEDAEDVAGWTLDGFQVIADGGYFKPYTHYYIAENRSYRGYDAVLGQGPYNFGWSATAPNTVEHFPYQDGLLITYVNSLYGDNNVSAHPGFGEALPVDARPASLRWSDGTVVRNRIQSFDSTFGRQATDPLSLHREVVGEDGTVTMTTLEVPSRPAVPVFDDSDPDRYYDPANPSGSVKVAGTGTTIAVTGENKQKGTMTLQVN